MRRPLPCVIATVIGVALATQAFAGCAGSDDRPLPVTGDRPPHTDVAGPGNSGSPATTTRALTGREPQITAFDAPTVVSCDEASVVVPVTFATHNATTIGFAIDGASASGSGPPLSGRYDLTLPCDGNAHVILLVAVGPEGQAVGTRAVRTGGPG